MNGWRGLFQGGKGSGAGFLVLIAAIAVGMVSARNYAGSWYDGSRLATVESLVDYRTLAIDRSIYVQVPSGGDPTIPGPYPRADPDLFPHGTGDKLFIRGHFYSDKSPVPALLMAAMYQALQWGTGLKAREHPDRFYYWMTVGSSGLSYVVAVWCVFLTGQVLGVPLAYRLLLTASFGLSTVALTYTRHVNNHILLLGVAGPLFLGLARVAEEIRSGQASQLRVFGLGMLSGLGYSFDLGSGPILLMCTLALVAYRSRSFMAVAMFVLAASPWLAIHHAVNYAIGGTFRPANSVPAYLTWPGSPFTAEIMTGPWNHPSPGHFVIYAAALLFGRRGFFGHNLPLFLTLPGLVAIRHRRPFELPEILGGLGWFAGTWLVYAVASTNYSGLAASIRWFVPLLVPAYFLLAVVLRDHPQYRRDFLILSAWGAVLAGLMWWKGPWMKRMVPFFWPLQAAALLTWILSRVPQG
ncbi:MAG TPA: hypothetical protein VLG48_04270, partial [Candidatus Methylomirabilis sp.]|nr:hypothetical protein [Candidatus Methylomirabilis sp.]